MPGCGSKQYFYGVVAERSLGVRLLRTSNMDFINSQRRMLAPGTIIGRGAQNHCVRISGYRCGQKKNARWYNSGLVEHTTVSKKRDGTHELPGSEVPGCHTGQRADKRMPAKPVMTSVSAHRN